MARHLFLEVYLFQPGVKLCAGACQDNLKTPGGDETCDAQASHYSGGMQRYCSGTRINC